RKRKDGSGIDADLSKHVRCNGSVAHQPACFDSVTRRKNRRNSLARCQSSKLDAPAGEEPVASDEEGVGPLAHEGGKGRIDLAARTGVENMNLQPEGAGGFLHFF